MNKKSLIVMALLAGLGVMGLAVATAGSMRPLPQNLDQVAGGGSPLVLLDRQGRRIMGEATEWNTGGVAPIGRIPEFLKQAVILSEDKRFYTHHGVDWLARMGAARQNLAALSAHRGASTITEQVVKMLHPRPRSAWSRWVEGFEAARLEKTAAKSQILEFYLNQVPYASNRRGVAAAARMYFDRDLESLSKKEMMALAILPRSPSRLDLHKNPAKIETRISSLAARMEKEGLITAEERKWIAKEKFAILRPQPEVDTYHFTQALLAGGGRATGSIHSTLDLDVQREATALLNERMRALARQNVKNAAAVVVDHSNGHILAWVVYGARDENHPGAYINAVTAPRQPGSSMKPFLYAMALENGWTAATVLNDEPLDTQVGAGVHSFRNYSRTFYGPLVLRDALANSLNVPAVLALRHTGREKYLELLHSMGMASLDKPADYYGDALALGAGEVSLLEMTQAYTALANRGVMVPLTMAMDRPDDRAARRIYSQETASIIGDILSDPWARRLEFPSGSLTFPKQVAVKTGTSTDFHDAWAFGYDSRRLVGVWMGNLSGAPSDGVTGASGPVMFLRSMFNRLRTGDTAQPLYISPRLAWARICQDGGHVRPADESCMGREELFIPGTEPKAEAPSPAPRRPRLSHPVDGLALAMDPRVPADLQAVEFRVEGILPEDKVEWRMDGELLAVTHGGRYVWPLAKGRRRVEAVALAPGGGRFPMPPADILVK